MHSRAFFEKKVVLKGAKLGFCLSQISNLCGKLHQNHGKISGSCEISIHSEGASFLTESLSPRHIHAGTSQYDSGVLHMCLKLHSMTMFFFCKFPLRGEHCSFEFTKRTCVRPRAGCQLQLPVFASAYNAATAWKAS